MRIRYSKSNECTVQINGPTSTWFTQLFFKVAADLLKLPFSFSSTSSGTNPPCLIK
jgi:hypothetical protein